MRVALIWESIPENTEVYVIEDPTPEQLNLLEGANGKIVNQDKDIEDVIRIYDMVCNKPEYCNKINDDNCIWSNCKTEFPVTGPIDKIFWFGWII